MKLNLLVLVSFLIVSNAFAGDIAGKKLRKPASDGFTGTCKYVGGTKGLGDSSKSTSLTALTADSVTASNDLLTDNIDYGGNSGTYPRLVSTAKKDKGQPVVVVGKKNDAGPNDKPHWVPDGHIYFEYNGGIGDGDIYVLVEDTLVKGGKSGLVKWRENGGDGGNWDTIFQCGE